MPTEYRRCRTCAVEKPLDDFYPDKARALGRRYVCKACELESAKTPKERERRRATSSQRYRKGREIIAELKDRPCADCGGRFPTFVMEFDHPDPSNKLFNVAMNCGGGITPKLLSEIEKCEVVCSNCHKIRTRQQRDAGLLKTGGRPRKTTA